jgi:hypothetical protein
MMAMKTPFRAKDLKKWTKLIPRRQVQCGRFLLPGWVDPKSDERQEFRRLMQGSPVLSRLRA